MTALTTGVQRNSNLDLRYYKQTDYGEVPSTPAMQSLRTTKIGFKTRKKTVTSKVIGTRQVEGIYKVGEEVEGSVSGELAWGEWEWAFEGLMGSTFAAGTVTVTATDISFADADNSINSVGAGFGSILAGMWLLISGTSAHNGLWYVLSKTSASKLILSRGTSAAGAPIAVSDEAAGASMTVKARQLRQGNLLNSYTFERKNSDNATFDVWNGFVVGNVKLTIKGDDLVTIDVTGMGKVADQNNGATISGSVTAPVTTAPFNSTNNLMEIAEADTVLSNELVSLDLAIDTKGRNRTSLGNSTPTGATQGTLVANGNTEFYFLNNTRRQVMQDHTEESFFFILKDPGAARYFIVTITRLYFQDLTNTSEDADGDTLEKYSFETAKDATYGQTITIDALS
jgi:Phage tail tube protein